MQQISKNNNELQNKLTIQFQNQAKGQRRMLATQPPQQQQYIDARNLWKASTTSQEKQYDSIRTSGLLSDKRKMTFLRFNYRQNEQRNLCYPDVFKIINRKRQKHNNSLTKIKSKLLIDSVHDLSTQIISEIKENNFVAEKDWLQEYHSTDRVLEGPFRKKIQFSLGTMNVNDLWGEKQLQQCLGFLPCKRDRPKMLKFYSSKLRHRRNKQNLDDKCKTEYL